MFACAVPIEIGQNVACEIRINDFYVGEWKAEVGQPAPLLFCDLDFHVATPARVAVNCAGDATVIDEACRVYNDLEAVLEIVLIREKMYFHGVVHPDAALVVLACGFA